jgi:hypothetical protein
MQLENNWSDLDRPDIGLFERDTDSGLPHPTYVYTSSALEVI